MMTPNRWTTMLAGIATAIALAACGGGGGSSSMDSGPVAVTPQPATPAPPVVVTPPPGAPTAVGNTAIDGRNWLNYRRGQVGVAALTESVLINRAAQAHSDYQKLNNEITHDEVVGKPGYTGSDLLKRLNTAGYSFANNSYAYGEVISAATNNSGFYMAEELITAIYHRFVIFEPQFKEIGAGSATTSQSYTYFTADFASNNGYGAGIGRGNVVTWPYNGQTAVTPNFFSDYEAPDPVAGQNEVGYPVSVHADITAVLSVTSFTIQPRGGSVLSTKLLQHSSDAETPASAAAIVPLSVLRGATTYDVSFSGTADGIAVTKNWSFTTK
jgi:uncharacterized protein YkwD